MTFTASVTGHVANPEQEEQAVAELAAWANKYGAISTSFSGMYVGQRTNFHGQDVADEDVAAVDEAPVDRNANVNEDDDYEAPAATRRNRKEE